MDWMLTLAQAATGPATQAAQAAQESAAAGDPWYHAGLMGFYLKGGWFMIPLFTCQVIGLGVIIERWLAYRAIDIDTTAFRGRVKDLLARNRVDDAVALCDQTAGPVAATIAVGLRRFKLLRALGKPADQIEADVGKTIDDYGVHIVAVLERHVSILAIVCALGPLFGFLGTVDGMRQAFGDIERAAGSGNIIQVTAQGIKVALYTTILGLCVGIPTQFFYTYFSNRVNDFVLEVEESATELIQHLALITALGGEALMEQDAEAGEAAPATAV